MSLRPLAGRLRFVRCTILERGIELEVLGGPRRGGPLTRLGGEAPRLVQARLAHYIPCRQVCQVVLSTCAPKGGGFLGVRYGSSSSRQQASFCVEVQAQCVSHEGVEHGCANEGWHQALMPCFHPIDAWQTGDGLAFAMPGDGKPVPPDLQVPCGRCIGCRLRRSAEWADRCMHEAQLHESNCFLTLTYDDEHLPRDGGLDHSHFQLFMRAVRRKRRGVSYYMCGEYGPLLGRPHFHACLFGLDFRDRSAWRRSESGEECFTSAALGGLWTRGVATVQDLTWKSASYCARYVVDKITGDGAVAYYAGKRAEYCRMSLRPGVGKRWFERYSSDLRHDYVVRNGREAQLPRYYDKLCKRADALSFADVKDARAVKARAAHADNTPERLRAKEEVQVARVRSLVRRSQ